MWKLLLALLVIGGGAAARWINAGQAGGPAIAIEGASAIGQTGEIAVGVTSPGGELTELTVMLAQGDTRFGVFDLRQDSAGFTVAGDRVTTDGRRPHHSKHSPRPGRFCQ